MIRRANLYLPSPFRKQDKGLLGGGEGGQGVGFKGGGYALTHVGLYLSNV